MAQREVILPRTVVDAYLDGTPLGVQAYMSATFDRSLFRGSYGAAMDANLALIETNLALMNGHYFDMAWRKPEVPA